jgi:flagellar basal-body rod modification protein FlgD
MASISSSLTSAGIAGAAPDPYAAATPKAPVADKNMFLQLLVSQLRNQDPLNPTDGTAFVSQLAQFQQLEQSLNMSADISAIRSDMDLLAQSPRATSSVTP